MAKTPEDSLTDLLVETLDALPPDATTRLLAAVCGVNPAAGSPPGYEFRTQVTWQDPRARRLLLVGISPEGGVTWRPETGGSSRIDAVIRTPGDLLVLFEFKIVGSCDGEQLLRHLRRWRADLPREQLHRHGGLPDRGVTLSDWKRVGAWLSGERERGYPRAAQERLAALALRLGPAGLDLVERVVPGRVEQAAGQPVAFRAELERTPRQRIIAETGVDLTTVCHACEGFHAAGGPHHVSCAPRDCIADARRVASAFEKSCPDDLPPGLSERNDGVEGNVMTPRRTLSGLYGAKKGRPIANAVEDWAKMESRLLDRGADQAVLLAMLAWAHERRGRAASNVVETVERLWAVAPSRTPAASELHAMLDA